jgi:Domain of unknown function (DUF4296)
MIFISSKTNIHLLPFIKGLALFSVLLIAGCKPKFPAVPSDVIPINKMESILIDMHISDAVAEVKTMGDANERRLSQQYYLQIYKNHGITKDEFLKSYTFYENNPILLNRIYDDILGEMSKREAKINK